MAGMVLLTRALSTTANVSKRACFGAGCYWGTDKFFKVDFNKKFPNTIKSGMVGFMNPDPNGQKKPSYREVCTGRTGHVEVYDFEWTGDATTYENMVKFFFQFHDPTTLDRQGNDRGTQYASAIFCYDEEQKKIAQKVKAELQELINKGKIGNYASKTVTTAIHDATTFYAAQGDHQDYLVNNPFGYCNHAYRFKDWPKL